MKDLLSAPLKHLKGDCEGSVEREPFAGAFTHKGSSPPEMGFYLACSPVPLHLDKLYSTRQFTTPQPQFLSWNDRSLCRVSISLPTFLKRARETWEVERKTCSVCPLYENRQGLEVFHLSFTRAPIILSLESSLFAAKDHCQGEYQAFRKVSLSIVGWEELKQGQCHLQGALLYL